MYVYVLVSYEGKEVSFLYPEFTLGFSRHDHVGQGHHVKGRLYIR